MIFNNMTLREAKAFYKKLKEENKKSHSTILKQSIDDIWFFTEGLKKDYGFNKKGVKECESRNR